MAEWPNEQVLYTYHLDNKKSFFYNFNMQAIPDKDLRKIKDMYYKKELSAPQISKKLGVCIDAVYYFMRKHILPRRNFSEQNKIRFERKKPSFKIKKNLTQNDEFLKIAGILLYWCEGSQWEKECQVDFANSNPKMILLFLKFLRKICGIDERKFRVLLYCYSNQNPKKLIKFWSDLSNIPKSQFTKPYIREDFRLEKSGKMKYGLVHIRYLDKKLLILLREWIEQYTNQILGR